MGRPTKYKEPRVYTQIRFLRSTHTDLLKAADERDVSMSWLVNHAVEDFLNRLIPVDELRLTRKVIDE